MNNSWLLGVVAMIAWAGWALALKGATQRGGNWLGVTLIAVAAELAVIGVVAFKSGLGKMTVPVVWLCFIAGLAGIAGFMSFNKGLEIGSASKTVIVSSLYPVLAMLGAIPLFGEVLTLRKILAALLAVGAVALLA